MAYRKPGVTVTQEFAAAAPALAAFNLPCCVIGPAYKLFNDELLSVYEGITLDAAYAGVLAGDHVDLSLPIENDPYPTTRKPISVSLEDISVEIVPEQVSTGSASAQTFIDTTPSVFTDVAVGDILHVVPSEDIAVVSAQTNGVSTDTVGQRNRLTAGTANQFAPVKVGDTVEVTDGTNTNTGTYTVTAKINDNLLLLSGDINDGVGPATDVEFSITGDRGAANEGAYTITNVAGANLTVNSPFAEAESLVTYYVTRNRTEPLNLVRDTDYTADEEKISIIASLQADGFDIVEANVVASYRALRTDLGSEVREYEDVSAIQAVFGVDQITPENPLAFALFMMKQNTVTAVNGLGLGANAATDEVLAYTSALEPLELTEMYALAPLSQHPSVHTLFKNHVEQLSLPDNKLERVVLVNSALALTMLLKEESTTTTELVGARIIVNTQIDGEADFTTNPAELGDATASQFLNVQPGDSVVIQSGTNAIPGTYLVTTKNSNNLLTLSGNIISSGSSSDFQYYIVRRDGIAANGQNFYDRDAEFISDGIAAGHFFEILSGSYKGRYAIGAVLSQKELVLAEAIPGIATLQAGIEYEINRNLLKTEQAASIKGYSQSLGSRRVVHCWPDIFRVSFSQELVDVPGYYFAAVVAALTTGLPTHQGFTNMAVSGFLGLRNSSKYFTEPQLNDIADGGTMIAAQDLPGQALYIRHQLTTDRTTIKFQEYSVTKNVDFIAKFTRDAYDGYTGVYNIVDTTVDELRTNGEAVVKFLKEDTILPRIGGVIRSGRLESVIEDELQIDTIKIRFIHNIPIPLNNIDITIVV